MRNDEFSESIAELKKRRIYFFSKAYIFWTDSFMESRIEF